MAKHSCFEVRSKIAPKRLFQAGVVDLHNALPLVAPQFSAGGKIIKGDGGVGTIRQFNFTELHVFPNGYIKEQIDLLDKENLEYQSTQFEGGYIGKKLASSKYNFKLVPTDDGGGVLTISVEYTVLPGAEFTEADIQEDKEELTGMFKAMEAYLLANPGVYA